MYDRSIWVLWRHIPSLSALKSLRRCRSKISNRPLTKLEPRQLLQLLQPVNIADIQTLTPVNSMNPSLVDNTVHCKGWIVWALVSLLPRGHALIYANDKRDSTPTICNVDHYKGACVWSFWPKNWWWQSWFLCEVMYERSSSQNAISICSVAPRIS